MTSAATKRRWELDPRRALHSYLAADVLPAVGVALKQPRFEVSPLGQNKGTYLYRERKSGAMIVCKFFGNRSHISPTTRRFLLNREFSNLTSTRRIGFNNPPLQVVRPLGKSEQINSVLVEDFARGHDLDYYIAKAALEGQGQRLFSKLSKMAHFLAELHKRTAGGERVDLDATERRFRRIVKVLLRDHVIDEESAHRLRSLCRHWKHIDEMRAPRAVAVHGDVTPTNFLFEREIGVTAIDLERMCKGDRVYDLGMLTGELKHHFAYRTGRGEAAEPFIGHFLWAYCEKFPDSQAAFRKITHRNRFYMALSELRIARNQWLPWEHRKWLAAEACKCLR